MVDIHTHILPEVDDGASSWEMAVHMCQMAADDGITHMVATPHLNDEYEYDRRRLLALLNELSQRTGPAITFSLGCDFHFSYENLVLLEQHPSLFTIGDTRYLLVEFNDFSMPPWITTKLQDLVAMGLHPIITHPERNAILQKRPEKIVPWVEMGCAVQLTASSFTGHWGARASKSTQWLMRRELVHIIATDCHDVEVRAPIMSRARDILRSDYGDDLAAALTQDNPAAVVHGIDLPYFPPPKA